MSLPHIHHRRVGRSAKLLAVSVVALGTTLGLGQPTGAEEAPLESLRAPFTCGTTWAGTTRSGHGLNDWNLDINSTLRTFADPNHDLGSPVLAQGDGTVVWIGTHVSAGTYVEIDYGDLTVVYVHLVDGSVPEGLAVGDTVSEGQQFAQLGGTGNATHAHLHLEYFDSRAHDDSRTYLLPDSNQIQIAFDGEPIDPSEAFISTNCDGGPVPTPPHEFDDVGPESFGHDDIALLFELGITNGTSPTTYSPEADVTREQMAAFLGRTWRLLNPDQQPETQAELPFTDIQPGSFGHDDIALLFELGITNGTSPTTYSPEADVTREQMAAFLGRTWRLLNPDEQPETQAELPFTDIQPGSFGHDDIALLFELGITNGTSPTTYSPEADVTREQMAAFLARLYRSMNP